MTVIAATPATPALFELAEGILFDERSGVVRWVDIWQGRILAGRLSGSSIDVVDELAVHETTGAVGLATDGGLIVAGARGLIAVSPGGALSYGPDLLGDRCGARLNDGSVDPQGRFVVGSLALGAETGQEVLLRVTPDGVVETLRSGIRLSNGIAFSPDATTIYHVDTLAKTVSSHSYGGEDFDAEEPWVPLPIDFPHHPDGLTVSSDGSLWIAQWGGSCVRRYRVSGEPLDTITVDAVQASCPGFVGHDLDVLAITTAQEGLTDWTDQAGAIFLAAVDATGLPASRWRGSTTTPYWHHHREVFA